MLAGCVATGNGKAKALAAHAVSCAPLSTHLMR